MFTFPPTLLLSLPLYHPPHRLHFLLIASLSSPSPCCPRLASALATILLLPLPPFPLLVLLLQLATLPTLVASFLLYLQSRLVNISMHSPPMSMMMPCGSLSEFEVLPSAFGLPELARDHELARVILNSLK